MYHNLAFVVFKTRFSYFWCAFGSFLQSGSPTAAGGLMLSKNAKPPAAICEAHPLSADCLLLNSVRLRKSALDRE